MASQYGPYLVSVYAFGAFPEGYQLEESEVAYLPEIPDDAGIIVSQRL